MLMVLMLLTVSILLTSQTCSNHSQIFHSVLFRLHDHYHTRKYVRSVEGRTIEKCAKLWLQVSYPSPTRDRWHQISFNFERTTSRLIICSIISPLIKKQTKFLSHIIILEPHRNFKYIKHKQCFLS